MNSRASHFRLPRAAQLWWVTPLGSVLMVVPLSLLIATRIPDADYRIFYKAPREISAGQAQLFLSGAGMLLLGTLVPFAVTRVRVSSVRERLHLPDGPLTVLRKAETIAFVLTVLGYVFFALIGAARGVTPGVLFSAVVSQDNYTGVLKSSFAPVAGVTSLTQFGIAYVVIAGLLLRHGPSPRLVRRIAVVLVLGLLRAYLLTERLALLELVVPLVAIGATHLWQTRRGRWLPFAPVLALPVLFVIFGAFEYSRSWQYYKSRTTQSFPEFVVNRLAGYYATSYNNGALQLDHLPASGARLPYASIEVFWTAPGIEQLDLYQRLSRQGGSDLLNTTLAQYGNPEFNNPGGLAVPFVDFGVVNGLVFFLLLGLAVGLVHRSWTARRPTGLLIFPVLFTGLLELPRYLYFTQGRVFPALLFLGITAVAMNRASTRTRRPVIRPAPRAVLTR